MATERRGEELPERWRALGSAARYAGRDVFTPLGAKASRSAG